MSTETGCCQVSLSNLSRPTTALQNYYVARWTSPPFSNVDGTTQISANTWTLNFAASESNASANFPVGGSNQALHIHVYVWRPTTKAKVGTIIDGNSAAQFDEPGAVNSARVMHGTFSGAAVSSIKNGDVIVLEMWARVTQASATSYTQTVYYDGCVATTTENQIVDNHASFLETPQALVFAGRHSIPVLDVTQPPYGAVTDVAGGGDAIQAAIDAFIDNPNTWQAIYVPPGTYKLSKPLILGRSGDFTRVIIVGSAHGAFPTTGYMNRCVIEWRDGSTASKTQPLMIIQGARRTVIEGIYFRAANTAPKTLADQGHGSLFQYEYADWISAGIRDNPHSPQCVVAIDPFIPDYPQGDPANRYPGLEAYYGGAAMSQPTSSSAVEFIGCTFEGGALGVAVSPAGGAGGPILDSGTGASSANGFQVTLSGDTFSGVSAGHLFKIASGSLAGQARVILSVDSPTTLTLVGSGFGMSFGSSSWEVRSQIDLIQNAESFEFDRCYWLYNRVHYSQGQSQSRANRITSPRMYGSFISIDDQLIGPGGNPGVNPILDGAPNIGFTRYIFNLGLAAQTVHFSNIYCESTASIGRLGTGLSSVMSGAVLSSCSLTLVDQKTYGPTHPDVPFNLDTWGIVHLIGCTITFGSFSGLLRVWNHAGRLILDGCKILMKDQPSGHVPGGFESSGVELVTRLVHVYNGSIGPVFQDDPKGAGKFTSQNINGGADVQVVQGANASLGTVGLTSTAGLNVGDVVRITTAQYVPERFPSTLYGYSYRGPVGQIASIVPNTSIALERLPKGFPFSTNVKLEVVRWQATS